MPIIFQIVDDHHIRETFKTKRINSEVHRTPTFEEEIFHCAEENPSSGEKVFRCVEENPRNSSGAISNKNHFSVWKVLH